MGNEISQDGVSGSVPKQTESLQPWTALSLYPQSSSTKDLPVAKSSSAYHLNQVSACVSQVASRTINEPKDNEPIQEISEPTLTPQDEIVRQAAELSLTAEEMDHINQVLSRVRQLEQREDARISKLRNELQRTEQEVRRRVSVSHQDVTSQNLICFLCGRMQHTLKSNDIEADGNVTWNLCSDCENQVCDKCGSLFGKQTEGERVWLCNLCQKKRHLSVSSGAWLQQLQSTSRQSKALKKMFAKKPIARTSSFTQYEEWLNRIENDTSDTSSAEDRPIRQKHETRRHSDKLASPPDNPTRSYRNRRRKLSRNRPVDEYHKDTDSTDVTADLNIEVVPDEILSSEIISDVQNNVARELDHRSSVEDVQSVEPDMDTNSLHSQQESEPEKANQISDQNHVDDKPDQVQSEPSTLCSEPEHLNTLVSGIQDEPQLGQETTEKSDYSTHQEQSKPFFLETSSPHDSEVIIHPETAEVKNLFLKCTQEPYETIAPSYTVEHVRETFGSNYLSRWSDQQHAFPEDLFQGDYDLRPSGPLDMYEQFNSTFDDEPLYEECDDLGLEGYKITKASCSETSRDRWFGSHESSIEEDYSAHSSSFFAAEMIRRSSRDQAATPQQINRLDFEYRNNVTKTTRNTEAECVHYDTGWIETHQRENEHTPQNNTCPNAWLTVAVPSAASRRGSAHAKLQLYNSEYGGQFDERHESRRASAPQNLLLQVTNQQAPEIEIEHPQTGNDSTDEHQKDETTREPASFVHMEQIKNKSMNSAYFTDDSNNYAHQNRDQPAPPIEVVQQSVKLSEPEINWGRTGGADEIEIRQHGYRSAASDTLHDTADWTATSLDSTDYSIPNSYPDFDAYERWITHMTQTPNGVVNKSMAPEDRLVATVHESQTRDQLDETEYEEDNLTILRRCPNFENISGLSEQVATHTDTSQMNLEDRNFRSELEAIDEEQDMYTQSDDQPTRVWYRDAPTTHPSTEPLMLTTLQQEDEIWASLFSPSDSLLESAKEVAAQLDLMTLAEEEMCESNREHYYPDQLASDVIEETGAGLASHPGVDQTTDQPSVWRFEDLNTVESTDSNRQHSTQYSKASSITEKSPDYFISSAHDKASSVNDRLNQCLGERNQSIQHSTTEVSITSGPDQRSTLATSVTHSRVWDAPTTEATETVTSNSGNLVPPDKSIEMHMFGKVVADCTHATSTPPPSSVPVGSSSRLANTAVSEIVYPQCIPNRENVTQTGTRTDHEAGQTVTIDRHVTTHEGQSLEGTRNVNFVVCVAQPDAPTEAPTQQRIHPSEVFRTNANTHDQPTSLASSANRVGTLIDRQQSPAETTVNLANEQTEASHTQTGLPFEQRELASSANATISQEARCAKDVEQHKQQFRGAGDQHTPFYRPNDSWEQHVSQQAQSSPGDFIQPLIRTHSDSENFDRFGVTPAPPPPPRCSASSSLVDLSQVENEPRDGSISGEQPNSDIQSPPIPLCSAISPQREAALIRLSVQRDRGLGLARRTLTSPRSTSPDTSDSFLSLLDISPDIGPGLAQYSSEQALLVRSNYIPPTACCAAWSYCSHAQRIATEVDKPPVESVITTEPVLIPNVQVTDYYLFTSQHSPVSAASEIDRYESKQSGRLACTFRRHVLEEIQEDQVLLSTQPSSVTEQSSADITLMSSSSSSRGSYPMPRPRPRSSSYAYDYYGTMEDSLGIPVDAVQESYSYADRRKQRSLIDVSPRNEYGLHWNEAEVSPSHLISIPTRTYPYDDMASSAYTRRGKLSDRLLNELNLRYSSRNIEDPNRSGYSRSYSASQTVDRHKSMPSDEYEIFREPSRTQRLMSTPKMHKYSTGSKLSQRLPLRKGYSRSGRAVGDDRRWQFRNQSYMSGSRDSGDPSGSNLSDDAEFIERRSQISLPLSHTTMRRLRESYNPMTRSVIGAPRFDNFNSLQRPASLTSSRYGSQQYAGNKALSRSTDHLNFRRTSGFGSGDTSMQTLRAKLAAAHSESHLDRSEDYMDQELTYDRSGQKYGSLDRRLQSDHLTTQQLRRQVEKQHRQLLRSLMDDNSSHSIWPPDLSLLHLQTTPFSASPYTITPQMLQESAISPALVGAINRETGGLISTTGAPPIFSTATSRPGFGAAYGWPANTGPLTLPDSVPSSIVPEFYTSQPVSMQTTPAVLEPVTSSQWPVQAQATMSDMTVSGISMPNACRSQPHANNLLELLGNAELLQSVASDPALTSQLASLGIDLNIPQANQVTLAAVAGAVAATAIAQSGMFETQDFTDPQATWPELNVLGASESTKTNLEESNQLDKGPFSSTDYTASIPPYNVSSSENHNLENLLQQLQTALGTGTETNQISFSEQQAQQIPHGMQQCTDTLQSYRSYQARTDTGLIDSHSSRSACLETGRGTAGPSEAIDSWLMPNYDHDEPRTLVNERFSNGGLNTSTEWPASTPNHQKHGSVKSDSRITYDCPTKRVLIMRDIKDRFQRDNGIGMRIVGGHIREDGKLGAFVEEIYPHGPVDQLHGEIREGDEILEWNSIPLVGRTFEEVQSIISQVSEETELLVRARTDSSIERDNDPPWDIAHTPGENRNTRTPPRVDALCHRHAAQQALMSIQSRSMCPHMQRYYLSMSPSEIRQSPMTIQQSSRGRSSPTGSDSASSNVRKPSSMGQALWIGGREETVRDDLGQDSSPSQTRNNHYLSHPSRDLETQNLDEFDLEDTRQLERTDQSPVQPKRERRGSFKHRSSKSDDLLEEFGEIELILTFDDFDQSLTVHVSRAKDLPSMDLNGLADPFVKVRLHPDPTEDPDFNRQTKYMPNTLTPEWQQTVVFMNCFKRSLKRRVLEVTVWDFDRLKTNDFMGQTLINLGDKSLLDGRPHWYKLHKMQPVVIPSARKTPPSSKPNAACNESSKQSRQTRELVDKKTAANKNTGKETYTSHKLNM